MTRPKPLEQLLGQLREPRTGPRSADPPDGTVWISGHKMGGEFALAVPVARALDDATLTPVWTSVSTTVGLQAVNAQGSEQVIPLDVPAATATHFLVLLWARVRTPVIFGSVLYSATLDQPAALPLLEKPLVEEAVHALWASRRDLVERSLIPISVAWPASRGLTDALLAATGKALAEGRDPHGFMRTYAAEMDGGITIKTSTPPEPVLVGTAFVFASCQYPAGVLDGQPAARSIDRLNDRIGKATTFPPIDALLLLGDQIYADASYGLLDPRHPQDRYAAAHQKWRAALEARVYIKRLEQRNRVFAMPDDHEIADNWEPAPGPDHQRLKDVALQAFAHERGNRKPVGTPLRGWWGTVNVGGGHEVFMLDTRTQRDPRPWGPLTSVQPAHLIDAAQRDALKAWLHAAHQRDQETGRCQPKLISSAVWLLPRHVGREDPEGHAQEGPAALSDSWDGYPPSLHWLLTLIAQDGIGGVVVLCGDGHLAGHTVARLTCGGHTVELHVLQAPALYAPFPFANAQPHQFATHDRFGWTWDERQVSCLSESALWPMGDGFTLLEVLPDERGWMVRATFDTGPSTRQVCWRVT